MTRLSQALELLDLEGEGGLDGRLVKLQGERCSVFIAEGPWAAGFYTWCDDPSERMVAHFDDPIEAIRAGLARASQRGQPAHAGASDSGNLRKYQGCAETVQPTATDDDRRER